MASERAIFVAATGQNVGKTTTCLGIIAGLKERYGKVGFIKPVGQRHVEIEPELHVDKDVALFKEHFHLEGAYRDMSPVLLPSGCTRDFIDGKVCREDFIRAIDQGFSRIQAANDYTVVEGTGHVGVGSIVGLSNAMVAAHLGLDMIIVASGGLGSAIDELALNIQMAHNYGVNVKGVILNRVLEAKREMILNYFPRALKTWDIPLLGCIPYNEFLSKPTMQDFCNLFDAPLISGKKHRLRRFQHHRLGARSVETYITCVQPNELTITPAGREDIICSNLERHRRSMEEEGIDFGGGLILTGRRPPSEEILEAIGESDVPVLYVSVSSYEALQQIIGFITKIRMDDIFKITEAINVVERNINFDRLTSSSAFSQ